MGGEKKKKDLNIGTVQYMVLFLKEMLGGLLHRVMLSCCFGAKFHATIISIGFTCILKNRILLAFGAVIGKVMTLISLNIIYTY